MQVAARPHTSEERSTARPYCCRDRARTARPRRARSDHARARSQDRDSTPTAPRLGPRAVHPCRAPGLGALDHTSISERKHQSPE